ncbi:MAG: trehalose-6-phosphate synthase, partial [Nitrospirota bacterium]|nr:trehalose-6-phosphate synthase [Nitrospirota bacterium]
VEEDRIFKRDREIRVGAFPIGVDPGRFETLSLDPEGMKEATRLLCEQGIGTEDTFLISVDRMDYTKGFIMRLRILESLFRNFPEWIGKIRLLQIAPPTRSTHPVYQNYQKRVREEVRLTNARWSREDWIPVLPVERTVEQPVLAPLYRRAAGALVTSTNDGMNLVAKEYLSAQKDRGGSPVSEPVYRGGTGAQGSGSHRSARTGKIRGHPPQCPTGTGIHPEGEKCHPSGADIPIQHLSMDGVDPDGP